MPGTVAQRRASFRRAESQETGVATGASSISGARNRKRYHDRALHLTGPPSSRFDPALVTDAARHGAVAWSQFNPSYERFLVTPWRRVNDGEVAARMPL